MATHTTTEAAYRPFSGGGYTHLENDNNWLEIADPWHPAAYFRAQINTETTTKGLQGVATVSLNHEAYVTDLADDPKFFDDTVGYTLNRLGWLAERVYVVQDEFNLGLVVTLAPLDSDPSHVFKRLAYK